MNDIQRKRGERAYLRCERSERYFLEFSRQVVFGGLGMGIDGSQFRNPNFRESNTASEV